LIAIKSTTTTTTTITNKQTKKLNNFLEKKNTKNI